MRGVSDADMAMEAMMEKPMAAPAVPPQGQDGQDPKSLIDAAIERVNAYVEDPSQVTPETVQELLGMLQQASDALGGGVDESLGIGKGPENAV